MLPYENVGKKQVKLIVISCILFLLLIFIYVLFFVGAVTIYMITRVVEHVFVIWILNVQIYRFSLLSFISL